MSDPGTTRLNHACPYCLRVNTRVTAVDDPAHRPEEGAVTVCHGCGAIAVFTAELTLRAPTPDELARIVAHPGVQRALQAATIIPARDMIADIQRRRDRR